MKIFYIALGANLPGPLGGPVETLREALIALDEAPLSVLAVSRFWRTPAFPTGSGPDFVNACATLRSDLSPADLLVRLHDIEAELGRLRDGRRWGPRVVDLDLLAVGASVLPDMQTQAKWRELPPEQRGVCAPDELILPHPRMQDRGFVLIPLRDIAPDWRHPVLGRSVAEMASDLPAAEIAEITPI